jgi:hypothetical protein
MQIVQGDQIPELARGFKHRQGTFISKKLLAGEPGTPGNFALEINRTTDDFFSPRHRHNFDQFRYQIEGVFDFDRNGKMKPGMLGYFPEGTAYGPQSSDVVSLTLVLQFGSASGSGYLSAEQVDEAAEELLKQGRFEKGVYRRHADVEGKRNVDGYQAIWEHVNARPMKYPEPRYHDPVMMNPDHFAWVPIPDAPGAYEKLMGVFTERRVEARMLRLDAGARLTVHGRSILLVLSGGGKVAGESYRRETTVYCETGEEAVLTASAPTEILVMGLPVFDRAVAQAEAAE